MLDDRQPQRPEFPGLAMAEAAIRSLQQSRGNDEALVAEIARVTRCVQGRKPKQVVYADGEKALICHSWIAGRPCKSRLCPLCSRTEQVRTFTRLRTGLQAALLGTTPDAIMMCVKLETIATSREQLANAVRRQVEWFPRLQDRVRRKSSPEKGTFRKTLVSRQKSDSFKIETAVLSLVTEAAESYSGRITKDWEVEVCGDKMEVFSADMPSRDEFASDRLPGAKLDALMQVAKSGLDHESFSEIVDGQFYFNPDDLNAARAALRNRHLIGFTGLLNDRVRERVELEAVSKPRVYVPS
jgi:hypothetical protein